MDSISSNTKPHSHVRSISLPSTSNEQSLFSEFYRFQASQETTTSCSSSSLIGDKLNRLNDMYESIQPFFLLPSTKQSLVQGCNKEQLNKFLDELVELLDLCSTTKDALSISMDYAKELQSVIRRKRGNNHGLTSSIEGYLSQRRKMKKVVCKTLSDLQKHSSSSSKEGQRTKPNINMLEEMRLNTLEVFESLLTFILGSNTQSKPKGWSLVSKMIGSQRAVSHQTMKETEVRKVDHELHALITYKKTKSDSFVVEHIQKALAEMEVSLLDLSEQTKRNTQHGAPVELRWLRGLIVHTTPEVSWRPISWSSVDPATKANGGGDWVEAFLLLFFSVSLLHLHELHLRCSSYNQMASISSNTKPHSHVRSISLPSTLDHQSQFNEFYRCQASQETTTSSSSSSIGDKLNHLNDMYESIQPFLSLPSTKQSLSQGCNKDQLNKFLDELVELLDLCSTTKDSLSISMDYAKELQSVIRRKRGDNHGLISSVEGYLSQRRKMKKVICKTMSGLQKHMSSSVKEDQRTKSNIKMLEEMKLNTLEVFESLLTFILGPNTQSKPKGWSLVSKMIGSQRVVSHQTMEETEVRKVDHQLHALITYKKTTSDNFVVEHIQKALGEMEVSLFDLSEQRLIHVDCHSSMYRETVDICDMGPFKRLILSPLYVKVVSHSHSQSSSGGILSSITYGANEIACSVRASITSQTKKNRGSRVSSDLDKGIVEPSSSSSTETTQDGSNVKDDGVVIVTWSTES
ncbi:hypothetical protein LXL04_009705 [Taraxacum kok-saghyz]